MKRVRQGGVSAHLPGEDPKVPNSLEYDVMGWTTISKALARFEPTVVPHRTVCISCMNRDAVKGGKQCQWCRDSGKAAAKGKDNVTPMLVSDPGYRRPDKVGGGPHFSSLVSQAAARSILAWGVQATPVTQG